METRHEWLGTDCQGYFATVSFFKCINELYREQIDIFEKLVKFQSHQWYYVDCDQSTKGPVITRMILHKVRNGDLDGMTLVFNAEMGEWKKISEVEDLKAAILKESEEEEAAEKALEASKALEGVQAQARHIDHQSITFTIVLSIIIVAGVCRF